MNLYKKAALGAAAIALTATPVVASAAQTSAQKLSVAEYTQARDGAAVTDANQMRGGFIIPAIAVIAIILAIVIAADGGDDRPTSP